MVGRAHRVVTNRGFTVAAIDAPGHGDRPGTASDEQEIAALQQARAAGEPLRSIVVRYNADLAARALPEWQTTLEALRELPEIGAEGPVGYFGVSMGIAIGVPLTAVEPQDHRRGLRCFLARISGRGGEADHRTGRVRAPVGRRARRTPIRSRVVRRLRLEGKDVARQRGHASRAAQFRGRQRGPVLRSASRPGKRVTGLT